jgi:hypothetical protein
LHLKHVEECYVFFEGKRVGVEIVAGWDWSAGKLDAQTKRGSI